MSMGRAFLVTGASSGIGRAAVAEGVSRGARVYASVRKPEDAESLAAEFGALVAPLVFDVVDEAGVALAAADVAHCQQCRRLGAWSALAHERCRVTPADGSESDRRP
jgi:NAD(P)-dependent dehydrogenase (short-subunit alcohol dehydrogenase family)